MKNPQNSRIMYVNSFEEALEDINQKYALILPVPIRGIITSVGATVDLSFDLSKDRKKSMIDPPFMSFGKHSFLVKDIEDTLQDGTELGVDESITRVAGYDGEEAVRPAEYASESRINFYAERAQASKGERSLLRPALLVYDKNLIKRLGGYEVALPNDKEERAKAILKAYVID